MLTSELLADLTLRTKQNLVVAETLQKLPEQQLNKKATAESWSALECFEHLNRYGDFYIPEITQRLNAAKTTIKNKNFSSGLLGNKFAKMVLPNEKPMKTLANMNPENSVLSKADLEKFIAQQNDILELLKRCADYDLGRIKTSISISKWIKLKLGDTLRVIIYHNQRHIAQAQRAVK